MAPTIETIRTMASVLAEVTVVEDISEMATEILEQIDHGNVRFNLKTVEKMLKQFAKDVAEHGVHIPRRTAQINVPLSQTSTADVQGTPTWRSRHTVENVADASTWVDEMSARNLARLMIWMNNNTVWQSRSRNFMSSVAGQANEWYNTAPARRRYQSPLSPRQDAVCRRILKENYLERLVEIARNNMAEVSND